MCIIILTFPFQEDGFSRHLAEGQTVHATPIEITYLAPAHDTGRTGPEVDVRPPGDEAEWREAAALLDEFAGSLRSMADVDLSALQPGFGRELDDLAATYGTDDATLYMALDRGFAVGMVAVRFHCDRTAELKRMYVRRAARGRGVADRLVARVVGIAATRGCSSVWLETLPGPMDPAIAVYRRCGFAMASREGTLDRTDTIVMERVMERTSDHDGERP